MRDVQPMLSSMNVTTRMFILKNLARIIIRFLLWCSLWSFLLSLLNMLWFDYMDGGNALWLNNETIDRLPTKRKWKHCYKLRYHFPSIWACCYVLLRAFGLFLFGVYSIVDFSISMDAETVIDAPLLDIYVFFLYHFCSPLFGPIWSFSIVYLEASTFDTYFIESTVRIRERTNEKARKQTYKIQLYLYENHKKRHSVRYRRIPIRFESMDGNNTDIIIHLITYIFDTVLLSNEETQFTMETTQKNNSFNCCKSDLLADLLLATTRTSTPKFCTRLSQIADKIVYFWQIFFLLSHRIFFP